MAVKMTLLRSWENLWVQDYKEVAPLGLNSQIFELISTAVGLG